jgi:hypothetical protein
MHGEDVYTSLPGIHGKARAGSVVGQRWRIDAIFAKVQAFAKTRGILAKANRKVPQKYAEAQQRFKDALGELEANDDLKEHIPPTVAKQQSLIALEAAITDSDWEGALLLLLGPSWATSLMTVESIDKILQVVLQHLDEHAELKPDLQAESLRLSKLLDVLAPTVQD